MLHSGGSFSLLPSAINTWSLQPINSQLFIVVNLVIQTHIHPSSWNKENTLKQIVWVVQATISRLPWNLKYLQIFHSKVFNQELFSIPADNMVFEVEAHEASPHSKTPKLDGRVEKKKIWIVSSQQSSDLPKTCFGTCQCFSQPLQNLRLESLWECCFI